MSILYEPFKDDDAISAALDRYWEEARTSLKLEGWDNPSDDRISERALTLAEKEARRD